MSATFWELLLLLFLSPVVLGLGMALMWFLGDLVFLVAYAGPKAVWRLLRRMLP